GGRQGLPNYVLYALAAAQQQSPGWSACNSSSRTDPTVSSSCVFNDVTEGDSNMLDQPGFSATTGYDLASGLGTLNVPNLINAWVQQVSGFRASKTTLVANGTTTIQHGQPISFTTTVGPVSGGGVPTGSVGILTNVTGAAGAGSLLTGGVLGPLDNTGSATGSLSALPGGQYN